MTRIRGEYRMKGEKVFTVSIPSLKRSLQNSRPLTLGHKRGEWREDASIGDLSSVGRQVAVSRPSSGRCAAPAKLSKHMSVPIIRTWDVENGSRMAPRPTMLGMSCCCGWVQVGGATVAGCPVPALCDPRGDPQRSMLGTRQAKKWHTFI